MNCYCKKGGLNVIAFTLQAGVGELLTHTHALKKVFFLNKMHFSVVETTLCVERRVVVVVVVVVSLRRHNRNYVQSNFRMNTRWHEARFLTVVATSNLHSCEIVAMKYVRGESF